MNSHKNARLTVYGRELLVRRVVEDGLRAREAAQAAGVSVRTAYKWLRRYQEEGVAGLHDRCSRPHHCPHGLDPKCRERIVERRKQRQTYRQISRDLRVGHSTVARILRRQGLNRLANLEPVEPATRYEHERPGDLPLRQTSCRLDRIRTTGAIAEGRSGQVRTSIQGQGGSKVVASGERIGADGFARTEHVGGDIGAVARRCAVQARSRAGLDSAGPIRSGAGDRCDG